MAGVDCSQPCGDSQQCLACVQNMVQPYRPLRELDVEKLTQDIIKKLTQRKD